MNEHKEFTLEVKRVAGIKVAGCEDCGGSGCTAWLNGCSTYGRQPNLKLCNDKTDLCQTWDYPCPTCAPWRELDEWLTNTLDVMSWKCMEGKQWWNIQSIRAMLESLGEWEDFRLWQWNHTRPDMTDAPFHSTADRMFGILNNYADILTSDTLMLKAAIEYLKGVE